MDRAVIGTAACLDSKTAVFPQRPLGAEAVRRLQDAQQHGCPDRTERRDLAEPFPRLVFLTLGEQIPPHFLAQRSQRIELLVVKLGPPAHSQFADLREPLATMAWCIDLLAGARNTPAAIDGLHPRHDPHEIFRDGQITAHQFLQGSHAVFAVIDRLQLVQVQQFGQLACIDAITLVAIFQQGIPTRIAYHQFRDVWLQQVVQPGGPGSFFKRDVQVPAQPVHKLQNHAGFRLDDAFHHDLSGSIHDRARNTFLVHVHTDIFAASHKRVFLSGGVEYEHSKPTPKGAPFILPFILRRIYWNLRKKRFPFPVTGLSGLRYLENSITLAELPAVSSLPARYRLLQFDLKFRETKDAV